MPLSNEELIQQVNERFLSVDETAQYCSLRTPTVRGYLAAKRLTGHKVKNSILIAKEEVEAYQTTRSG